MKPKGIKEVSSGLRSTLQKAEEVLRKNNREYAITILKNLIQADPSFTDARRLLREQEVLKTNDLGGIGKAIAGVKSSFKLMKGKTLVKKKPLEGMKVAEDILALNLNNLQGAYLLSDSAINAKAGFVAIEILETLRDYHQKDETLLRKLVDVYKHEQEGGKILEIMQILTRMHPDDLKLQGELRAAAASATMQKDDWEEEGTTQEKVAKKGKGDDKQEGEQQGEKIIRNIEDIKIEITKLLAQIEESGETIDIRRKLGEFYYRLDEHDKAIEAYNAIIRLSGTMDPAIDALIEKSEVAKFDIKIKALKEDGKGASAIKVEEEKTAFRLERGEARVKLFPNDLQLRYNLGLIYFEIEKVDDALEQFQLAQRNPQRRLASIIYLGRCFHLSGQEDLSIEHFDKAIKEMPVMDKEKISALYYCGVAAQEAGNIDRAKEMLKHVYGADIKYKDVSQRLKDLA